MKRLIQLILVLTVVTACNSPKPKTQAEPEMGEIKLRKVLVQEVIQTTKYTYLYVDENQNQYWVAVAKQDLSTGEELFFMDNAANEMINFHSQELNRDFPSILFISQISKEQGMSNMTQPAMTQPATSPGMNPQKDPQNHTGRKTVPLAENVSVEPAKGGVTIAMLYASKAKFGGKKIKVRGNVVKVNNQVMGRNWVHLQDGTKNGEEYDLTCTTQETVAVGAVVTFEGVIGLEKDFTSGYFYPVIMEDAVIVR